MLLFEAVKCGKVYRVVTCPGRGPQIPVIGEEYRTRKEARENAIRLSGLVPGCGGHNKYYMDALREWKKENRDRLKREAGEALKMYFQF